MSGNGKELEVKFFLADLPRLERRLQALGAQVTQPRTHEINLRFDTANRDLSRGYQVLRLRKDTAARVTYKGPGTVQGGARLRQELEYTVDDFATAQAVFEALGYEITVMYEKYRSMYQFGRVLVTLDEMPYGTFSEIEGPDGESIHLAAERLGLRWERRILDSYLMLFDHARNKLDLNFNDLSFENFVGLEVDPAALGVHPGDQDEQPSA